MLMKARMLIIIAHTTEGITVGTTIMHTVIDTITITITNIICGRQIPESMDFQR